jgi:transposase InsO family protein
MLHAFPIRALQVDSGSEYAAEFEAACQQHGLDPVVLLPRSPKPNGTVERANRTHTSTLTLRKRCLIIMASPRLVSNKTRTNLHRLHRVEMFRGVAFLLSETTNEKRSAIEEPYASFT